MRYHWRKHAGRLRPSGVGLIAAALGAAILAACPGVAAERLTFPSVYECTIIGHFTRKTCIDAFDDAWDVYRERVPRFRTRAECNAQFKVCVVFNAPSYGGRPPPPLKPADVTYAPPLLGVVMSQTGEALQVQVDTTRKPLVGGVPLRNAAKPGGRRPGLLRRRFCTAIRRIRAAPAHRGGSIHRRPGRTGPVCDGARDRRAGRDLARRRVVLPGAGEQAAEALSGIGSATACQNAPSLRLPVPCI